MSNRIFLFPLAWAALCSAALAQAPTTATPRPLTEKDLLKTLDNFSVGDPVNKAPMSAPPDNAGSSKGDKTDKPAKKGGQTVITSKEASFDQKSHLAIFMDTVTVVNPEFSMTSDKLTAYLKHSGSPGTKEPPAATPSAKPAKAKRDSGGLDKAVAEGHVIITQEKTDEEGKLSYNIGRGEKAVYDSKSGDVTLTGRPQVTQGINTLIATDDSTIIIMNHDAQTARAIGPSKTVITDTGSASPNGR